MYIYSNNDMMMFNHIQWRTLNFIFDAKKEVMKIV